MDIFSFNSAVIIFIISILCIFISKEFRFPVKIILLLTGMVLGSITVKGIPLFRVPNEVLTLLLIVMIPVIVFDIFSRIRNTHADSVTYHAVHTVMLFFIMSVFFLGLFFFASYSRMESIFISIFIAISITASSQFDVGGEKLPKLYRNFLREELLLSNVVMLIFAFTILSILILGNFIEAGLQILVGISVGFTFGIVLFRLLKFSMHERLSHGILLLSVIFTYLMSDILGGNGFAAIATFAFFFGNVTVKGRRRLTEFSTTLVRIFELMLFIIVGVLIPIDLHLGFLAMVFFGFILYLVTRFIIMNFMLLHDFSTRERIFLTLSCPKGTVLLLLVLFIFLNGPEAIVPFLDIPVMFIFFSLIVSYLAMVFERRIVRT